MCFSATASFTAGIGLTSIGIVTVRMAPTRRAIPFASIPLLFGIQQLSEGIIWLWIGHSAIVVSIASVFYLTFSHIVWPTLLPTSVLCLETIRWRRMILWGFVVTGLIVSGYFLYYLSIETITTSIVGQSITYRSPHFLNTFLLSPYTAATCASCLFSHDRIVNAFGVIAFIGAVMTSLFFHHAFISVWCFFGAILSVMIYVQVRQMSFKE